MCGGGSERGVFEVDVYGYVNGEVSGLCGTSG